jgi:hypothetical protein
MKQKILMGPIIEIIGTSGHPPASKCRQQSQFVAPWETTHQLTATADVAIAVAASLCDFAIPSCLTQPTHLPKSSVNLRRQSVESAVIWQ